MSESPGSFELPRPGERIDRAYLVERQLGTGSMGSVVLATDEALDRKVAIKFARPELRSDDELRARMRFEAQLMAKVRHENVAGVYSLGELDGVPYFVMEFVDGEDLDSVLAKLRGSVMKRSEGLRVLDAICQGVHAIHSVGATHGDIKPSNIMIERETGRVVLTDFGAARLLHEEDPQRSPRGTPAYIAPENLGGEGHQLSGDTRADVYSIGVLAYELLTGRLPFEAPTVVGMLRAHLRQTPPEPTVLNPELSPSLDPVLLGALQKNPASRTASVDILREQLIEAGAERATTGEGLRFVVADDDPVFSTLARSLIKSAYRDAEIITVEDGDAALEAISAGHTSALVLDLEMPKRRGVEVVRALRSREETAQTPVVVVTGEGGASDWRELSALGTAGFLVKPVDLGGLLTLLRRLVEPERV